MKSWNPKITDERLEEAVVGLIEQADALFGERFDINRGMQCRLAMVLSEPDIVERVMGRLARNGLGLPA